MKLTCVTATFNVFVAGNRERLIECVRSVAALKVEHEHLVYDGASTDGTVELLRELERTTQGLKVVSEPDSGIYNALNKGVRDARGEWFYVLGSDDAIIAPETVDRLLLAAADDTQVLVAAVDGGPTVDWAPTPRQDLWKVLLGTPYCHQGVFMRIGLVRRFGGFDERFQLGADYDLILKTHLAAVPFHFVDMEIARYAVGGASGNDARLEGDFRTILCEQLKMSRSDVDSYRDRRLPPISMPLRYLNHPDLGVRTSARFMARRWVRHYVNIAVHAVGGFWVYHFIRRLLDIEKG